MAKGDLTQKQENFVQAYARTGNAYEAYCTAYNAENMKRNTIDKRAHELLHDGKIRGRLDELRERVTQKTVIDVDKISQMLQEDRQLARYLAQASAATAATMGLAKVHGLIINKSEDVTPRRSSAEILARLRQLTSAGNAGRDSDADGRSGEGGAEREAVPTVPGHGTA